MTSPPDRTGTGGTIREAGAASPHGTPPLDPARPTPNDGRVQATDAPKLWYANERIQLPPDWREVGPAPWFRADRHTLMEQPGFHIIGICPRCRHQTTSVCATEYLASDLDGAAGTAGAAAEAPAALERAIAAPGAEVTEWPDDSIGEMEQERRGKKWLQAEHQPSLRRRRPSGGPVADGPKTQVTVLRCACVENHVPAEPGAFGCGSEWLLQVEYDDSTQPGKTYISVVDPETAYRYWPTADAAAAEVPAALTTAQSAAKNWAGALTAILGLIGIGTLLGSRTAIQSFSPLGETLFGVFAFVAVLADAAMLYQSDLATFGWPKIREALKPSDQWNADLDPLTQASASVRKLRRSVWAAAISGVAALAAIGILLFAPPASAPSKSKVVYVVNGVKTVTSCGTVTFPPASATGLPASFLTFTPAAGNGKPESISLSTVAEIGAC